MTTTDDSDWADDEHVKERELGKTSRPEPTEQPLEIPPLKRPEHPATPSAPEQKE